jgi:hypothetical protein
MYRLTILLILLWSSPLFGEIPLRQSTASQEVPLGFFVDSSDGNTEETGLSIANTDVKIWKNGATSLVSKNSGGAIHISNGVYYVVLDATDTDTIGPMVLFIHVAGALPVKVECVVYDEPIFDVLEAANGEMPAQVVGMDPGVIGINTLDSGVYDTIKDNDPSVLWKGDIIEVTSQTSFLANDSLDYSDPSLASSILVGQLVGFFRSDHPEGPPSVRRIVTLDASQTDLAFTVDSAPDFTITTSTTIRIYPVGTQLETIRNKLPSRSFLAGTSNSTGELLAADVWTTPSTRTLTAGTNIVLPNAQTFSTTGAVGSVTNRVTANMDQILGGDLEQPVAESIAGSFSIFFRNSAETGPSSKSADDIPTSGEIWNSGTRTLTAGTNIVLAKGVGLTGLNDLSTAQVNTEVDTALADVGMTSVITGRIDAAISTRSDHSPADVWDSSVRTLTSGGGATAQQVWEYATRSLTDKSNFALSSTAYNTIKDNDPSVLWKGDIIEVTSQTSFLANDSQDFSDPPLASSLAVGQMVAFFRSDHLIGPPSVRRIVTLDASQTDLAFTVDSAPDFTIDTNCKIKIYPESLTSSGGATAEEIWEYGTRELTTQGGASGGGILHAKIASSSLNPDEFLEVIQGEEKILTFIVEADGRFDNATAEEISVKLADTKGNSVVLEDIDVERITEELDIQVFRVTLTPEQTASLEGGLLRIQISFDTQKAILTHSMKIREAL